MSIALIKDDREEVFVIVGVDPIKLINFVGRAKVGEITAYTFLIRRMPRRNPVVHQYVWDWIF